MDTSDVTAYNELVERHMWVVPFVLSTFTIRPEERDDLEGEANLALCEAAVRFFSDPGRIKFSTLAHRQIRFRILDYWRTNGTVKNTVHAAHTGKKAQDEKERLSQELGREPTDREFGDRNGNLKNHLHRQEIVPLDPALPAPETHLSDFDNLPLATRTLVDAVLNGATLGEVATEWGAPREELAGRLIRDCNLHAH